MNHKTLLATGAAAVILVWGGMAAPTLAKAPLPSYPAQATAAGAQAVEVKPRADGGVVLGGTLEGRQFALAIPKDWNHQALLFAHGYSMPDSSVAVSTDPVDKDPGLGLLRTAYEQGFAVGHSAYAKAGVGVEAGAKATLALDALVEKLGAKRVYVSGGSMGGSIVMTLIEQHPHAFVGALSACGVTDSWTKEIGGLIDMRAVYNYLAKGTPYALPGEQDLAKSALPTLPPSGSTTPRDAFQTMQVIKVASPLLRLFSDAKKDPDGQAAAIVRKVASLTGFDADPASFIFPLVTALLGMDDMRATFGGNVYGNRGKTYAGAALTADELSALNRDVQRIDADPVAVAYARTWHETSGRARTPLVVVHNAIDPLVPHSQFDGLKAKVEAHGNPAHAIFITVPAMRAPIPGSGVEGYVHCGFTREQMLDGWTQLRAKVEHSSPSK
jgi:pimeloyl-ACP methyl ester carboxylesterase